MNIQELTKNYYKKLSFEAWLKSAFVGFAIGGGATLLYSFVAWFFGFKSILVSLAILFAVAALVTVLFYFFRFKPTDEQVARRIDALGLEERIITCNELKDDNSYIAKKQREDAVQALSTANSNLMKFVVSVPLAIVFGLSLLLTIGATVFVSVSKKPGKEVWAEVIGEAQPEYQITYEVLEGGYIEGDIFQIVKHGESATPVTVIPDEGYVFYQWVEDGHVYPYREMEIHVTAESLAPYLQPDGTYLITAVCINMDEIEMGEPGDGEGMAPPDGMDMPPSDPSNMTNSGGGNDLPGGDQAGGTPSYGDNSYKDGQTDYTNDYDEWRKNSDDRTQNDNGLSSGKKDAANGYIDSLG